MTPFCGVGPWTLIRSVPRPPVIVVLKLIPVLRMKKRSSPAPPSTSSDSMFTKLTFRPAPNTPSFVTTKSSPNSVPMTMTVSKPSPPSMLTGALTAYWIRSAPAPPLRSVNARKSSCEPASAKAWTRNVSSPSSPFRSSTARLWKTMNVSLPLPPFSVIGLLMPLLSQPCVVSIVANTSSGAIAGELRRAARLVELADLEEVGAVAAVDVDDRARVVDIDLVARSPDVAVRDRVQLDVLEVVL